MGNANEYGVDVTQYESMSHDELLNFVAKLIAKQNEDPKTRRRRRQYESNHDKPERILILKDASADDLRECPRDIDTRTEKYPPSTLIDTENWAIFDAESVTKKEIESAFFTLRSMLHQITWLAGRTMPKDKRRNVTSLFELLDTWEAGAVDYYLDMVKNLAGDNSKNKNRGKQKVGNIGISRKMF